MAISTVLFAIAIVILALRIWLFDPVARNDMGGVFAGCFTFVAFLFAASGGVALMFGQ